MSNVIATLAITVGALSFAATSLQAKDGALAARGADTASSPSPAVGEATEAIAAAAEKFLATLDDNLRGKVVYDFKDDAQRRRLRRPPECAVS